MSLKSQKCPLDHSSINITTEIYTNEKQKNETFVTLAYTEEFMYVPGTCTTNNQLI